MRVVSLLFISILLLGTLQAQNSLKLGLRVSPIISSANVTDAQGNGVDAEVSSKLGGSFGLMADYYFSENYGFHTGIHIVNKGFKRDGNVSLNDTATVAASQNVSITTVEIPLALKLKTGQIGGSDWNINGLFGLSADVTASNSNAWTGINPATNEIATAGTLRSQANLVNPINFSFLFGAGTEYDFSGAGLGYIGLVYHWGLTNMNRKKNFAEGTLGSGETFRISYFSIDLGYYF
ncbi:MAG: PorT family protein [Bacteroidia bacterium]|nr:PorT family protein [Bacteroidia bacterium]